MTVPSPEDIADRVALGDVPLRDVLLRAVELFRDDPCFAMPAAARGTGIDDHEVVVFGTTQFSQVWLNAANKRGVRTLAVVDDFRPGLECGGRQIISSRAFLELARRHPKLVAVSGARYDRAVRHFDRLAAQAGVPVLSFEQGIRRYGLSEAIDYRLADWGPAIAARTDEYLRIEGRAADEYTRETLYAVLLFHLTGAMEWIHSVYRPYPTLYFRTGLYAPRRNERFVDCGASIGESTGGLLALTRNQVERVWMIEPDKYNQAKLRALIAEQGPAVQPRLSLHDVAVGSAPGTMPFNHVGGHGGSIATETHSYGEIGEVRIEPVDAIVDARPTLIKMDIEGAELDALKGARRSIVDGRPVMTISAYHRATDLIDIPDFVCGLDRGYRIGLRHHTEERWDTCLYFLPA
ncbi:MAG: FkbM family methyltransferase [Burkholderiales bacterium]|nr:FkbM family methyltransferase [Burkholderiales bacterium]